MSKRAKNHEVGRTIVVRWSATVLAFIACCPLGASQAPAAVIMLRAQADPNPVFVPETGIASSQITIDATAEVFVCPSPQQATVALRLDRFEKWAGAFIEPKEVQFTLSTGPTPGSVKAGRANTTLHVMWDMGMATRNQSYRVLAVPGPTSSCSPRPTWKIPVPMVTVNATRADASQAQAEPPSDAGAPMVPGPASGFLVGILVLVAGLRRARR